MPRNVVLPKKCPKCGSICCDHPEGKGVVNAKVVIAMFVGKTYQAHIDEIARQAMVKGVSFLKSPLIYSGLDHLGCTDTLVVSDNDEQQPLYNLQQAIRKAAGQQKTEVPEMRIIELTILSA